MPQFPRDVLSEVTGVYIDEVEVSTPPYDDPDIITEFVGFGATRDYMLEPASMVTKERVKDFLDTWDDKFGIKAGNFRLRYTLLVRARTERGARSKARAYVRAVNPFSPDVIRIKESRVTKRHSDVASDIGPLSEFHDVVVEVEK